MGCRTALMHQVNHTIKVHTSRVFVSYVGKLTFQFSAYVSTRWNCEFIVAHNSIVIHVPLRNARILGIQSHTDTETLTIPIRFVWDIQPDQHLTTVMKVPEGSLAVVFKSIK